jgi:hypothetical protein
MNKLNYKIAFTIFAIAVLTVFGCKKTTDETVINEPITLVSPDSATVYLFPSDTLPVHIKFTTDRPISYVKGMYEVNETGAASYNYTYPDTLFAINTDTLQNNLYEYKGVYRLPDSLQNTGTIVRFKVNMKAQTLSYEKQFKIVLY